VHHAGRNLLPAQNLSISGYVRCIILDTIEHKIRVLEQNDQAIICQVWIFEEIETW